MLGVVPVNEKKNMRLTFVGRLSPEIQVNCFTINKKYFIKSSHLFHYDMIIIKHISPCFHGNTYN